MKKKSIIISIVFLIIIILGIWAGLFIYNNANSKKITISKLENIITGTWQAEVKFPDWKGYIDDTLAMNSMYSFDGVKNQGKLYFTISKEVEEFDLFVNNKKIDTKDMKNGIYEVDISKITLNGTNTVQVSNIIPSNLEEAITVSIPYPRVIEGTLKEVRTK